MTSTRQARKLTPTAMEWFNEQSADFEKRLKKKESELKDCLHTPSPSQVTSITNIKALEEDVSSKLSSYEATAIVYIKYLEGTKTEQSLNICQNIKEQLKVMQMSVKSYKSDLDKSKQELLEKIVASSRSSKASGNIQSRIVNLEEDLDLMKKEAELVKEKARCELREKEVEADLKVLKQTKVLNALKEENEGNSEVNFAELPVMSKEENIQNFLDTSIKRVPDNQISVNEFSNYILRKELTFSRIQHFTDNPTYYYSWKSSFKLVTSEINVNPTEEIDLLIKYLGTESKKQALNLKSVYKDPTECVVKIWERLDERFGSPEIVNKLLQKRIDQFNNLKMSDTTRWYDLDDLCHEIEALKLDPVYSLTLTYYDSASGIASILGKLPGNIQERWASKSNIYKAEKNVYFTPFSVFVQFIHEQAKVRNDPSIALVHQSQSQNRNLQQQGDIRKPVMSKKTEVASSNKFCPYHESNHSLNKCRAFRMKSLSERKKFLKDKNVCFRCCEFSNHKASECKIQIKCCVCGNVNHPGALHVGYQNSSDHDSGAKVQHQGGEKVQDQVNNGCTQICGSKTSCAKSCAKIILVNVVNSSNCKTVTCYAILDDQSNKSLAKPELFNLLQIDSRNELNYTINSCAGVHVQHGRQSRLCSVLSVDGSVCYPLPNLIECPDIPDNRNEICSPQDVGYHPHLEHIASQIPEIRGDAKILLLIGRDLVDVHQVFDQVTGPPGSPFAQRLSLGWVVVGDICLGSTHCKNIVNVNKIQILNNGRPSLFEPCPNKIDIYDRSYDPVFIKYVDDDKPSLSMEDKQFLDIMDKGLKKTPQGKWTAPLPFKSPRQQLPNNRVEALRRAYSFHNSLMGNPEKKGHMVDFMKNILEKGHAEVAPDLDDNEECWYLPLFGVYHPQKKDRIRGVFDASAKYQGISLNDVLLQGPDLINNLLGVIMRFRCENVAVTADIEQMFYCFEVNDKDRNYLRFFWYKNNNLEEPLLEYRMTRHVFGNSPSPAIATYGLRKSVDGYDSDVQSFVKEDFYVDDGLTSLPHAYEAVDLVKRTQEVLKHSALHLHKIASNNIDVMRSFPKEDLAKDLKSFDFSDILPTQRSLGLGWDLNTDSFVFNVETSVIAPSRRKILSVVNSVFDPLGFLAPFTIVGKLILRDITSENVKWDDPISPDIKVKWRKWESSLHELSLFKIPRSYCSFSLGTATSIVLHVFCDASELAISAVAYLVCHSDDDKIHVGFVFGKSKIAPKKGHTIPRLELCSAVLATEIAQTSLDQLKIKFNDVKFYTDSKIVLGYINNQTRRFYTYVANRIEKIRKCSIPKQWNYIPSRLNPADVGSRGATPLELKSSSWLNGPGFLFNSLTQLPEFFPIIEPEKDKEIRPQVNVGVTKVYELEHLGSRRFERFSSWSKLVKALTSLRHLLATRDKHGRCNDFSTCSLVMSPEFRKLSELLILKVVQSETFQEEITCLKQKQDIPKYSSILSLDPYVDSNGVLRVGGRLSRSDLDYNKKHPVIVPGRSHVAKLLVSHYHDLVQHQGRLLTEGAIRDAGFWIIGGKRLISSFIFMCVTCKKLRGKFQSQKMSDLPSDRVIVSPPFTYCGVDVFGPYNVIARRTRGGQANSKRWAVLFTCLGIRAVHIEVIDEMSSSSFINAVRRFISIRGPVKQFRSDRGSNFVGATDHLQVDVINVEDDRSRSFLGANSCQWVFNAPHSSHFGGSWERMIGIARRILESMLKSESHLTHDVLATLMAEVSAIINSRPIVSVSSDPDNPEILSPNLLLTLKTPFELGSYDHLDIKDVYRARWRHVQYLADKFWSKWKNEYLNNLQKRRKWHFDENPIEVGNVVLLKDKEAHRNDWPLGLITRIFPSADKKIRKVEVKVIKDGKITFYTRPVVELVLLVKN